MTAFELYRAAALDGVTIRLSRGDESLRLVGGKKSIERWAERVKEREEEIISLLYEKEERAAIYEYDAKLSREESERRASLYS